MPDTSYIVFLSYAREDAVHARTLYENLRSRGIGVWFDEASLLPGQRWKSAISEAIRKARFFIALLSPNSVDKKGVVQSELAQALEELKLYPPNQIYLIPARLGDCQPAHPELRDLQWVDLFPNWDVGLGKILTVLGVRRAMTYPFLEARWDKEHRPFLPIVYSNPENGKSLTVFATIDTGADCSIVPDNLSELLGFPVNGASPAGIVSSGGHIRTHLIHLDILLQDPSLRRQFVLARNHRLHSAKMHTPPLLGRDILQQFHVQIDYPGKQIVLHGEFVEDARVPPEEDQSPTNAPRMTSG